jgi:predicted dehydrogenase
VGVIGLGLIAQAVHIPNLVNLRGTFRIVHVCDLSRTVAAAVADGLPGAVRVSTDWRAVCHDPDLDAVLVLTPGDHAPKVLAALEAGKHVLTEKPLCVTVAEARQLERAAEASGRVLQVAYMKMYDPVVKPAREALPDLGTRRLVRIAVLHPADAPQFEHWNLHRGSDVDRATIAEDEAFEVARVTEALGQVPASIRDLYRGPLLGSICHELSLMRAVGLPLPGRFESARAWPLDPAGPGGPAGPGDGLPCVNAVADLGDGSLLDLNWTWLPDYPDYFEEIGVFGTRGRMRMEMPGPYLPGHRAALHVERFEGDERRATTYRSSHVTAFVHELEAFAASVRDGAPILSTAAGAAEDLACLQELAAAVGRGIGLDIVTETDRLRGGGTPSLPPGASRD